jgi:long-chain fatty acid transport protein
VHRLFFLLHKAPVLFLGFLCWLLLPPMDHAFGQTLQRVEIPSSPNPVGSGARALGMGGAFIAVADDATAASWNPGGLIQLEKPEISLVAAFVYRNEDNHFGTNPEASGSQPITAWNINYLSVAYPFSLLDHNMVVSLNYQYLYDFNRSWRFPLQQNSADLSVDRHIDYRQSGNLAAIGLAYCVQVTPKVSLGATLNIWEDWFSDNQNQWEQKTREQGSGTFVGNAFSYSSTSRDDYRFSGFNWNANLGVLWNITDQITFGAVVKTPFTADLRRHSTFSSSINFPDFPGAGSTISTNSTEPERLRMPMSYGIGLAYRFSDQFTVAGDIYRTDWQDFELKDSHGNKISPITGRPTSESDIDPTYQVRLGAEYLFMYPNYVIPLRAGVFYDPAPAEGSPDNYYGFSLGTGLAWGRFVFDIAYQYRFGRDVGDSILQNLDFSQDVDEHTVYASMIVHF